jgi:hypothetical protein
VNRLKYAGLVINMGGYSISMEILGERFGGKRPVGRPRSMWEDNVGKDTVLLLYIRNRKPAAPNRIGRRNFWGP